MTSDDPFSRYRERCQDAAYLYVNSKCAYNNAVESIFRGIIQEEVFKERQRCIDITLTERELLQNNVSGRFITQSDAEQMITLLDRIKLNIEKE